MFLIVADENKTTSCSSYWSIPFRMFEILLSIDCCVIREWTDDGESQSALTNEKRVWLTIGQLEKRIWQVPHLSWSHCTRCSASEPVQTQNLHYDQTTVLFFLFFAELQTPDGQTTWKAGGIFGNEKVYRKACSVNCQEDLNQDILHQQATLCPVQGQGDEAYFSFHYFFFS